MQQTLFHLPHFLFEGWLALGWLLIGLAVVGWQWRLNGWNQESLQTLVIVAIGAVVIYQVFPMLEEQIPDPEDPEKRIPGGLAIRGYGMMFLFGAVGGIGISLYRAQSVGMNPDHIMGLAMSMFIVGIIGARMFYVIQYRDQFMVEGKLNWPSVVNMTQGGLVVYGSVVGGLIAAIIYLKSRKLPMFAVADIIAPGMLLGLALGRLGCLMNGCCFGGACDLPVAVKFPPGSPPYMRQLENGALLGLSLKSVESDSDGEKSTWQEVTEVREGSLAASDTDLLPGDLVQLPYFLSDYVKRAHSNDAYDRDWRLTRSRDGIKRAFDFRLSDLPERALPIHPTQIYSSINAILLCLLMWFAYPFRSNDGELFGLMLVLYPISRFVLEMVRTDEGEQLGTGLTISQLFSFLIIALGIGMLIFSRFRARGTTRFESSSSTATA